MRKRRRERGCNNNKDKELRINPKKFFKIILHRTLEDKTLRIPAAIAKKFNPQLPTQATLTIRTGLSWKIKLENIENELCFGEGMSEFMEQNGIEFGYFLEFEYQTNNQFQVYIFDLSCTEIDYPTTHDQYANNVKEHVEAEKDMPIHRDDDIVLDRNSNNPSFTITVKNYNVSGNCYLQIPQGFIDEHLDVNLYKSNKSKPVVTLQRGNGREWHVSSYFYKKSLRLSGPQWKEFILDNHWHKHRGEEYTFLLVHKTHSSVTFEVIKKE